MFVPTRVVTGANVSDALELRHDRCVFAWAALLPPTLAWLCSLLLPLTLTVRSRLGCQIIAKPEIDGLVLTLPAEVHNLL